MTLSHSIKKRFCKDYNLPIQIFQEPLFSYYMAELDEHFGTKEKIKMLMDIVNSVGEEGFFAESNKVKDTIIESIQSNETYTELQQNKLEEYNVNNGIKQQDIYNMKNDGKTFVSIDLKHANFNVFKMFDSELVLGFDTYEDMVGSVINYDYFKKSKYLRQVIFGNLLPKKQQKLQKWVINKIITVLNTDVGIKKEDFVTSSSDEVVFVTSPENVESKVETVLKKLIENPETSNFIPFCKVDAFTLKSIGGRKFFVKEGCLDNSVDFKSIQSYFFMQVYKKYLDKPITDMDKKFYFDGMIATFDKGIFEETE